jgi:hypothetical protein
MIGFTIETNSSIFSVDYERELRRGLHMGAGILRDMLEFRFRLQLQQYKDTGASLDDVKATYKRAIDADELAEVHTETEHQLQTWGRVYVEYIEGGTYGQKTYTNPPRLIVAGIEQNYEFVEDWALEHINLTLDNIENGTII